MMIVCCLRQLANSNCSPHNDGDTVQQLHFEGIGDCHKRVPDHPSWEVAVPYLTGLRSVVERV